MNLVRPLAKAAGKLETRDAILQHYVQLGEQIHLGSCRVAKLAWKGRAVDMFSTCRRPQYHSRGSLVSGTSRQERCEVVARNKAILPYCTNNIRTLHDFVGGGPITMPYCRWYLGALREGRYNGPISNFLAKGEHVIIDLASLRI